MLSKLAYSETYKCLVDREDGTVYSARAKWDGQYVYGLKIVWSMCKNYLTSSKFGDINKHKVVADACLANPRPDYLDIVDHIDGNTANNLPWNLRFFNTHLNNNNRHQIRAKPLNVFKRSKPIIRKWDKKITGWKYWWEVRKCSRIVATFHNITAATLYAISFNAKHLEGLYNLYLKAPPNHTDAARK